MSFSWLSFFPLFHIIMLRMQEYEKKDFSKILKRNSLEARRWMRETDSTVARVYDRNIEAFPVTVELYDCFARVVDYAEDGMADDDVTVMKDLISRFLYVEHDRIIYLRRRKREGREQHEKSEASLTVSVRENGLTFECELERYVDTGLFLDHAQTREMVRSLSAGMRVLNLFSYTGSFSVYAAAGGAESVVSVDLSNVYTAWARRNRAAGQRRWATERMSCIAAPLFEVTSPIFLGKRGIGFLLSGANSPSCCSRALSCSNAICAAPIPSGNRSST